MVENKQGITRRVLQNHNSFSEPKLYSKLYSTAKIKYESPLVINAVEQLHGSKTIKKRRAERWYRRRHRDSSSVVQELWSEGIRKQLVNRVTLVVALLVAAVDADVAAKLKSDNRVRIAENFLSD